MRETWIKKGTTGDTKTAYTHGPEFGATPLNAAFNTRQRQYLLVYDIQTSKMICSLISPYQYNINILPSLSLQL